MVLDSFSLIRLIYVKPTDYFKALIAIISNL